MVISWVNTWYIAPETYTCIARYLLAGVGRPAQVLQRPRLRPWRQLEFPGNPFWLSKRRTLKAQFGCETLLASGDQAGTDCRPSRGCAALSDSESARLNLNRGAARQRFTGILDHDLFGCSCELDITVEPPASTGGRQVGLERKTRRPGKLGRSKTWAETQPGNFPRLKLVHLLVDKSQST